MAVELTGPDNCAECGTGILAETVLDGDAGALVLATDTGMVEVPGLYVCTNCAGEIMVGERQPTATPDRVLKFLTEDYAPALAMHLTLTYNRFIDVKTAVEELEPGHTIELGVIPLP